MKFYKFNTRLLRNEEWYGLYAELLALIPAYGALALGIADLLALFEPFAPQGGSTAGNRAQEYVYERIEGNGSRTA
ncbi:MAG: hypothetical protein LBB84_04900 [Tannerellaceae bacterium]|jgi:hypothetical protein|nr:hypothetical protein [Tannerellaceae bacterium]